MSYLRSFGSGFLRGIGWGQTSALFWVCKVASWTFGGLAFLTFVMVAQDAYGDATERIWATGIMLLFFWIMADSMSGAADAFRKKK